MTTYISILRGINVGGQRTIKMDALKDMFSELKFENAETYIQSGNVIFQYKKSNTQELEKKISKKISDTFGFEVPVIVKDFNELKEIANNNPFVNKRKENVALLYVTLLSAKPLKENIDKMQEVKCSSDEFIIKNKTIYLFCPNGYGSTKLSNTFFENTLKVTATTRNWRTINELIKIAEKY